MCESSANHLLYRQQFESFSRGSIGDGYDVVACAACGACFATGLPDAQRFAQYYADSSKYDLGGDSTKLSQRDRDRFADQAAFVAANVAERGDPILDVGTAAGGFLDALRGVGFERPYGIDPSPDAARVAHDQFGLQVAVGGLEAAGAWDVEFGVVTYVAVLEHLLDPRAEVRAVSHLLRRGGFIFVSVPNAGSFKEYVDAPFQEFSVEHVNYFTQTSLTNALAAEGYSLIASRTVALPLGSDGQGPALEAVYRWDGISRPAQHDETGADDVREYIRKSKQAESAVLDRISRLASAGERIFVWGTGTHTLHLLEVSRLGDCRIEAFLDSNPHYAGGTLIGRPVLAPSEIHDVDAPILVSSAVSQSGIVAAAQERFGPDVPLILLY